jgi:hypothetical protein
MSGYGQIDISSMNTPERESQGSISVVIKEKMSNMKFYKLRRAIASEDVLDEELAYPSKKVYPNVNGATIKDATARRAFIDKRINRRTIYRELPILDHFYCYNGTNNNEYDWILLDGY